jgi:3'-phosphoadenosine 5'-phosphosulfate sulfotransferase (PAPS reductase)/FAD synthetase
MSNAATTKSLPVLSNISALGNVFALDLTSYDIIIVNTSGGKDSQCQMGVIVEMAKKQGCLDKVIAVHADLGRMEHTGTMELAREQAEAYGLPFIVVTRKQGDILDNVMQKHESIVKRDKRDKNGEIQVAWPDKDNSWCTSEHKTAQVMKLVTKLVDEFSIKTWGRKFHRGSDMPRKVRILSCLGLRSEESGPRSKRLAKMIADNGHAIRPNHKGHSNGKRSVDEWFPIESWTTKQVWDYIEASGVRYAPTYDGLSKGDRCGMSRLSCCFCICASKRDLVISARKYPELAEEYIKIERATGKTMRQDFSITELVKLANSPEGDELIANPPAKQLPLPCDGFCNAA